jgi:hypothetical protein
MESLTDFAAVIIDIKLVIVGPSKWHPKVEPSFGPNFDFDLGRLAIKTNQKVIIDFNFQNILFVDHNLSLLEFLPDSINFNMMDLGSIIISMANHIIVIATFTIIIVRSINFKAIRFTNVKMDDST